MNIKRITALTLAFILLLGLTAFAAPEEPAANPMEEAAKTAAEEALCGNWYGILHGLNLVLTLQEGGTYTLVYPEVSEEPAQGTWVLDDGFIYMDAEEIPSIAVMREVLSWTVPGVLLEREAWETYKPAEIYTEAAPEDFSGYWESAYLDLDGALVYASDMQEDTFLYIEGTHAALGGSIFGDVIAEFTFADGAMIHEESDGYSSIRITMNLLEDGMLALTLSSDNAATGESSALKILLVPAYNEYASSREGQE